jgi:predicted Zn-dependent protease
MLTREEALKLAEKALKLSTFPNCRVTIDTSEQAYTRFANNGITTAALGLRFSATIEATRDGATGSASTNDIDDASLAAAVKRAEEIAALAPPSAEWMPDPGKQEFRETNDYDEKTALARSPEMIPHIKTVIDAARAKNLIAAGLVERTHRVTAIANKRGLRAFHRGADAGLTSTIRAADGSSSGWAGHPATRFSEIDSAKVAADAIEKCLRWKNPRRLEPGNYTVVLDATATGDLVRLMSNAFNARAAEEGRSFLSKRGGGTLLGEKLFPEFITLRSDPFDPRLPSSPWTGDLLPTRPMAWIEKGVVKNLSYNDYWASKTGKTPTPAPGNTILEGSDTSQADLIASVKRGLLVTHFFYIRAVNAQTLQQTGLTRDGLFLIEDGKITDALVNFRFNESPVRLLQNARALGRSIRIRGLEGGIMIAPPLVADNFPFTSISDAV